MAKKKRKLDKIIYREKTRKKTRKKLKIIIILLGGYYSPIAIHASFI